MCDFVSLKAKWPKERDYRCPAACFEGQVFSSLRVAGERDWQEEGKGP